VISTRTNKEGRLVEDTIWLEKQVYEVPPSLCKPFQITL
jgi:hypothetical protein